MCSVYFIKITSGYSQRIESVKENNDTSLEKFSGMLIETVNTLPCKGSNDKWREMCIRDRQLI